MKPTKTKIIFLYSIFLITLVPIIYVYQEHATVELEAYHEAQTETKKIKTFSESFLFMSIAWGYVFTALLIIVAPQWRIPYLVLLVGTVAVVMLYYFRINGIQIPGTDIVIFDFSTDWRDQVTKICQQIIVIPATALLILNSRNKKD